MLLRLLETLKSPAGRARAAVGLILAAVFCFQCQRALRGGTEDERYEPVGTAVNLALADEPVGVSGSSETDYVAIGRQDPEKLLRLALRRYRREIRDYTCTFNKIERIGGKLTKEQVTEVKFRQEPFSVMMHWVRNADKAERVIYVAGQNDGQALVRPAGAIARFFVKSIRQAIDGPLAKTASRRRINQFGFERALELTLKYYVKAKQQGDAGELVFGGLTTINDRPAIKLIRKLPDQPDYPDQRLEIYLDREWLLPTCLVCRQGDGELLGQYFYTDVRLNVGLSDEDFDPATYGM